MVDRMRDATVPHPEKMENNVSSARNTSTHESALAKKELEEVATKLKLIQQVFKGFEEKDLNAISNDNFREKLRAILDIQDVDLKIKEWLTLGDEKISTKDQIPNSRFTEPIQLDSPLKEVVDNFKLDKPTEFHNALYELMKLCKNEADYLVIGKRPGNIKAQSTAFTDFDRNHTYHEAEQFLSKSKHSGSESQAVRSFYKVGADWLGAKNLTEQMNTLLKSLPDINALEKAVADLEAWIVQLKLSDAAFDQKLSPVAMRKFIKDEMAAGDLSKYGIPFVGGENEMAAKIAKAAGLKKGNVGSKDKISNIGEFSLAMAEWWHAEQSQLKLKLTETEISVCNDAFVRVTGAIQKGNEQGQSQAIKKRNEQEQLLECIKLWTALNEVWIRHTNAITDDARKDWIDKAEAFYPANLDEAQRWKLANVIQLWRRSMAIYITSPTGPVDPTQVNPAIFHFLELRLNDNDFSDRHKPQWEIIANLQLAIRELPPGQSADDGPPQPPA